MPELPKRYTPIGKPASGGLSHVFKCKDSHLERDVAIKFIQDENEKARLLDELRALLQLRSKHVVQVYDIVPGENDSIGIVEEYIEGEDLLYSDFPCLCLENYLKTLWQIAAGIADIHAAGVIHRDIKPNNMKLDPEGIVKIFDFGLAKNEGINAKTSGFKGTMGFAAPELFGYSTVTFTPAIDTYAFAANAIYLAYHDLPPTLTSVPPQPVTVNLFSKISLPIPTALAELLNSCFAFDPSVRPSMATLRDELARHLLRDKHQAFGVYKGKSFVINADNRSAGLDYPGIGKVEFAYDGLRFYVSVATGEIYINNSPAVSGDVILGSCVVTIGDAYRANSRVYITLDISNPEVVL